MHLGKNDAFGTCFEGAADVDLGPRVSNPHVGGKPGEPGNPHQVVSNVVPVQRRIRDGALWSA